MKNLQVTKKVTKGYKRLQKMKLIKRIKEMINKNSEKYLEKKLREEIKLRGGIALKFTSPYVTGIPDRIVLMPKGKIYFIELKSKNKKPTEIQKYMMEV